MALSYMERGLGCIVCGTTDAAFLTEASQRWLAHENCPLCEAPASLQEARPETTESEHALTDELSSLQSERRSMQDAASAADLAANEFHAEFMREVVKRDRLVTEHYEKAEELRIRLGVARGASPNHLSTQDERIRVLEETVKDDRATKSSAVSRLDVVVNTLRENLENFQAELCASFNSTIKAFLSEECTLSYRVVTRKIGQDSDDLAIEFPEFMIRMTSGVFRVESEVRLSASSVSESQREFIELALRMALLSVAARSSPCTLILDTPEASLDAVFIPLAGEAFHKFADDGQYKRLVLAASNLNGTAMIPSMLGVGLPGATPARNPESRLLNLLNIAAKGRAFETYSAQYEAALQEALRSSEKIV